MDESIEADSAQSKWPMSEGLGKRAFHETAPGFTLRRQHRRTQQRRKRPSDLRKHPYKAPRPCRMALPRVRSTFLDSRLDAVPLGWNYAYSCGGAPGHRVVGW